MHESESKPKLKRAIGLPLLVFYGVGTIVGGGFYALTGEVAGEAGMLAPIAFLVSSLVALISAFSFAELSARFPVSAGEAHYVKQAFGKRWLSSLVGWLVILTGIVSAAALANAFAGFLGELIEIPRWITILLLVAALGTVAIWGIGESVALATIITLIEIGGLLFVFLYCSPELSTIGNRVSELIPGWSIAEWTGILVGAYLACYSFVGFEDMVNIAEEVKQPSRNLPRAILMSVVISGSIYFLVCLAVVLKVPPEKLAGSEAPFSLVLSAWPFAAKLMALVGMLAGVNGALIQIIMGSRVAYGLSKAGQGPSWLATVHPKRQTPVNATLAVTAIVLTLAIFIPIVPLAKATTTILLIVFAMVNVSLLTMKIQKRPSPEGCPNYPFVLPLLGTLACFGFVSLNVVSWFI